jgi:hypothetical protein
MGKAVANGNRCGRKLGSGLRRMGQKCLDKLDHKLKCLRGRWQRGRRNEQGKIGGLLDESKEKLGGGLGGGG